MTALPLEVNPIAAAVRTGSFWTNIFGYPDQIVALAAIRLALNAETQGYLQEATENLSRLSAPLFHQQVWLPITLSLADMERVGAIVPTYGQGYNYGDPIAYGQVQGFVYRFTLPALTNGPVVAVKTVLDRPAAPSNIWTSGIDFQITNGFIEFTTNPLSVIRTRAIIQPDGSMDTVGTVWLYQATIDTEQFVKSYGTLTGCYPKVSTESYRTLVNAIWDTFLGGPSNLSFRQALAAMAGTPLVGKDGETVQAVLSSSTANQVITDLTVYDLPVSQSVIVDVGDTLYAGDVLTNGVEIFSGATLANVDLPALVLEPGMIAMPIQGSLVFSNQLVAASQVTGTDGNPHTQFPIGGWPQDLETFWSIVQANEIATGITVNEILLAEFGSLTSVNPMRFLIDQMLPNGLIVAQVTLANPDTDYQSLASIQRLLPAYSILLCTAETAVVDSYNGITFAADAPTQCNAVVISTTTGLTLQANPPVIMQV